jgi:hypothetical protein
MDEQTLEAEVSMGELRAANHNVLGSAVVLSGDKVWDMSDERMLLMQHQAMTDAELSMSYLELLRRALVLVNFWEANVGANSEWPVVVRGDSAEAAEILESHVYDLYMAAGHLVDL